jgi:anti-sigma regulatory factor (Ser/Thr protein kinase)
MAEPSGALAEERLRVAAAPAALDEFHAALDRFWGATERLSPPGPEEAWRHEFATAVIEIGTNIVAHSRSAERSPALVVFRLRLYDDRVEACLLDRGIPFVEPPAHGSDGIALAVDDVASIPEGGYGLPIARATLDGLRYRRSFHGTNFWHLVKRRAGAGGDTGGDAG